jgi:hypothetical protein
MNLFQWITLPLIGLLLLWELLRFRRGATPPGARILRMLIWLAAGVAIAFPNIVQDAALALGIGLGVNLVLYLFVFAFLWTSFAFYSRHVRLQRQLTLVVRHIAIQEARQGGAPLSGER